MSDLKAIPAKEDCFLEIKSFLAKKGGFPPYSRPGFCHISTAREIFQVKSLQAVWLKKLKNFQSDLLKNDSNLPDYLCLFNQKSPRRDSGFDGGWANCKRKFYFLHIL